VSVVRAPASTFADEKEGEAFVKSGREFLLSLSQLLSVSRFHQLDNEAIRVPTDAVSDWTGKLCQEGKRLEILFERGQVYLNQQRLRLSGGVFETVESLGASLEARKLAGLEIRNPLSPSTLRAFLACYNDVPRGTSDPATHIEQALTAAAIQDIVVLRGSGRSSDGRGFGVAGDVENATLLYAKAVVLLREMVRRWDDESARSYLGARVTRVVQGIISLVEQNPRPFLWLIHVKDDREYLFTHGANVALLSILLGNRLGIDRNRLCTLGGAALVHDLGHLLLPRELDSKEEAFSGEDRKAMALHPVHGVNLLLQLRRLDDPILTRIVVVFEHNIASNGYPCREWPRGLHLFSRIVAIADAYDAMTNRRPFRPARTPHEALRELEEGAGSRYDPDLVRLFTGVLGIHPLGTVVRLDSGELAIVFHVDPSAPARPLVKVVVAADGTRLAQGPLLDLDERDGGGKPRRSIVGILDPAQAGINVAACLWETAPT
jgi:HD-GYP domain-containing protein (c-di-GMP phosphodiesterase class II)